MVAVLAVGGPNAQPVGGALREPEWRNRLVHENQKERDLMFIMSQTVEYKLHRALSRI